MALTDAQRAASGNRLTASRVGVLMSGDPEKVLRLWEEMTGQCEEEDLSDIWPVQLGIATEALNLAWYEKKQGRKLSRHGEVVLCPTADWACCTLDGFDAEMPGPIDAKWVGGFEPRPTVVARYTPQMHWQMICCASRLSALSIIEGGREPVIEPVPFDEAYADELWARAEAFMQCVWALTPPVVLPAVAAPIQPEQYRTVDMSTSNAWAAHAATFLRFQSEAKAFDGAKKELSALVEKDVGLAFGHGVEGKRSKTGALTIKAMKG